MFRGVGNHSRLWLTRDAHWTEPQNGEQVCVALCSLAFSFFENIFVVHRSIFSFHEKNVQVWYYFLVKGALFVSALSVPSFPTHFLLHFSVLASVRPYVCVRFPSAFLGLTTFVRTAGIFYLWCSCNRWLSLRLSLLGCVVIFATSLLLVWFTRTLPHSMFSWSLFLVHFLKWQLSTWLLTPFIPSFSWS